MKVQDAVKKTEPHALQRLWSSSGGLVRLSVRQVSVPLSAFSALVADAFFQCALLPGDACFAIVSKPCLGGPIVALKMHHKPGRAHIALLKLKPQRRDAFPGLLDACAIIDAVEPGEGMDNQPKKHRRDDGDQ